MHRTSAQTDSPGTTAQSFLKAQKLPNHEIVDAATATPEDLAMLMHRNRRQVPEAIPVYPQFFVQEAEGSGIRPLGDFRAVERMMALGTLPGQEQEHRQQQVEQGAETSSLSSNLLAKVGHLLREIQEAQQRPSIHRSQSMRPVLRRGTAIQEDDSFRNARPPLRMTRSMTSPVLVQDTLLSNTAATTTTNHQSTPDLDETETSHTELVLLEDEPLAAVEVALPVRAPATCSMPEDYEEEVPPVSSEIASRKTVDEIGKKIDESTSANVAPERFVTPVNSFRSPVERKDSLDLNLAPRTSRNKLKLDLDKLMATSGSFRRKLFRGSSLLESNPASRTSSFSSQNGSLATHDVIQLDGSSRMTPPVATNDPIRFVTPINSFINTNSTSISHFPDDIEVNRAPRNVLTVEDFERCLLLPTSSTDSDNDSVRRKLVRGPSLLRSNNNSSFRRSISRGVSRYSTDDSLATLKEEVKVEKKSKGARRGGNKNKKASKVVVFQDHEDVIDYDVNDYENLDETSAPPPSPPGAIFGLVRKRSIMRRGGGTKESACWEGTGSHHTKNTVTTHDVSSSEDYSEMGSFAGDSHNDESTSSCNIDADIDDDDSDSDSSTEFEEQEEDLSEPILLTPQRLSVASTASTASGNSWSLYESFDERDARLTI